MATFGASYRRALAFPLHRSFALAETCRADVASFLAGGKRLVVRCLLDVKDILDHHDIYYVYSKIWVDDFCLWAQAYARSGLHPQLYLTSADSVPQRRCLQDALVGCFRVEYAKEHRGLGSRGTRSVCTRGHRPFIRQRR